MQERTFYMLKKSRVDLLILNEIFPNNLVNRYSCVLMSSCGSCLGYKRGLF